MTDERPYQLTFALDTWEQAVAELLIGRQKFAWAALQRNFHMAIRELIVHRIEFSDNPICGADRPPLFDWALIEAPNSAESSPASSRIETSSPRRTQLMTLLQIGLGEQRRRWIGAVVNQQQVASLAGIRLIGASMPRIDRDGWRSAVADVTLDESSIDPLVRWSRTIGALGEPTWRKVRQSSVLLFGAGRTGSLLAEMFVKLGIGKLDIVDGDTVQPENLDAMFGVSEADIGRPKSLAVAERLHAIRSDCSITAIPRSVNHPMIVDRARGADLIVTAVDNDTPRLAAALLAQRFLKVHLDVGTAVQREESTAAEQPMEITADIRLLLPHACVCCVGGLADIDRAWEDLRRPPNALPMYVPKPWHEQRAGSLITINALAAGAIQCWLDLLAGQLQASFWQRLRWVPGRGLQSEGGRVGGAGACRVCKNYG